MRAFITSLSLSALMVCSSSAWASRCAGWPATRIVFCDDFDQYCTANDPANPWPGYPPTPDTKCATSGATADATFFRQSYHWPSLAGTNADMMGISSDNWGSDSLPFHAYYYGYGATTQYHRWNLVPTVSSQHPGYNAVNGTDANPLYLRFFFGDPTLGSPPNSPLYVELALDEDRAPTDYVNMDCNLFHDCNCVGANPSATCSTGTCQAPSCVGSCGWYECSGTCQGGPNNGVTCTSDSDCSRCVGGPNDGGVCSNIGDPVCTKWCNGGTNLHGTCASNSDCPGGTCSSGPNTGLACVTNTDCGACVGGSVPGTGCTSNFTCQFPCGTGQQSTCQDGPHQGTACTLDSECSGGPLYPIVTQQWLNANIVAPHPGLSTTIHKSIAYGQLAQTDRNPCDVETGRKPTQYHACTFDGLKWWDLRSNVFPGNSQDFNNDGRASTFQMWVKTSSYVVWLDSMVGPDATQVPQHSEATIPRQYTGPFNRIAMGTGPGCQLDPVTGACITAYGPWTYPGSPGFPSGNLSWQNYGIDNLIMMDGVLASTIGACCKNDATCVDASLADCLAQSGHYQGTDTTCASTTCCPYPFADADKDGDVNQDDFGLFQICYSGTGAVPPGCGCFDRNKDNVIDGTDFAAFSNCWTGPNVPWSAGLTPLCTP